MFSFVGQQIEALLIASHYMGRCLAMLLFQMHVIRGEAFPYLTHKQR